MSRKLNLPIPIISAIKNEFKKRNLVVMKSGIRLSEEGVFFVKNELGYNNLNIDMYNRLINLIDYESFDNKIIQTIDTLLQNRPEVDVTVDQSKCTNLTAIKRAILVLKNNKLINKNILCVGDDDLISISMGLLIKSLYNGEEKSNTEITVIDIDERILLYIEKIAKEFELPIVCIKHDVKLELPVNLINKFDCILTDPPYSLDGLKLFVSRGISSLKEESNLQIFLSFGHKNPLQSLYMQGFFYESGLEICSIYNNYNMYEGAEIIGNTSDMIILNTTTKTISLITSDYDELIYTGEIKKTIRIYECINCKRKIEISIKSEIKNIEKLKELGCPDCNTYKFNLKEKKEINNDYTQNNL
jgi:N4-bis(aminopropyl)spermidine synthase